MTLHDIENAITGLPPDELPKFRAWFVEFDADAWDRQFEDDVRAGRLDSLAEECCKICVTVASPSDNASYLATFDALVAAKIPAIILDRRRDPISKIAAAPPVFW